MDNEGDSVISQSDREVSGKHPQDKEYPFLVASSTSDKTKNTIRLAFALEACWKVEDICFDFDRAFVRNDTKGPFRRLAELRDRYPTAPISLFGHTDHVGKDKYNKQLSEDRAKAIYGVLTRNVQKWKEIFDKADEVKHLQRQLAALGHDPGPADGILGPKTKSAILAHMDELCGNLKLTDSDFLGEGKCAFQGCSEFNPLRIFSKEMGEALSKQERKADRNNENQPNRRVIAFLFKPEAKIDPSKWPCPKASEGTAKCEAHFWPDAKQRRTFQEKAREFRAPKEIERAKREASQFPQGYLFVGFPEDESDSAWTYEPTSDTFTCEFYERLARLSPCERYQDPITISIMLYDDQGEPLQDADYRITFGDIVRTGKTVDGWLVETLPKFTADYVLEWGESPSASGPQPPNDKYPFKETVGLNWLEMGSSRFGIRFE
jgi:hypothetical protein